MSFAGPQPTLPALVLIAWVVKGLSTLENEFDLWAYGRLLLARWPLIIGLALLSAVIITVVKFALPPTYAAEALVSVAPPQYSIRLEGVALGQPAPVRAYPELALSGDVLQEVLSQFSGRLPADITNLDDFRGVVAARPAADPTLLRLVVQDPEAALAAEVANAWADIFALRAGQLIAHGEANLQAYEQQLAQAKADLDEADRAFAAFQAANEANILQAQLASRQMALADALSRDARLSLLIKDTRDLLGRLDALDPGAPAHLAEDLALLDIMTWTYGAEPQSSIPREDDEEDSAPLVLQPAAPMLQIQVSTGQPLAGPNVSDQHALALNLLSTLEARQVQLQADTLNLEPAILALQGELAAAEVEEDDLARARDLADDHYRSLASKFEEAKIAVREAASVIQVASRATVPTEPAGVGFLGSAVLAAAIGGLIGCMLVLFAHAWQRGLGGANPALAAPQGASD